MGFLIVSCATLESLIVPAHRGVYHTVGPGEDLWRISRTYVIDAADIARYNNIFNPEDIESGERIFIPGAKKVLEVPPPTPEELAEMVTKGLFRWPVDGMIYSLFGPRWGRMHYGVDISAPVGTDIRASRSGDVVFVGRRGGYGVVVEIKHDEHFLTIYAHLSKILVEVGERVRAGEVIGRVGCTGRCTGPHCHFEIRYDNVPLNPLYFLP
jgi:murein DD-endopeptidase MepM/ murein hydrolase activator NlpD